ncbi:MFS transporter [Candidatus Peregrinibacteria bacterium]|nr:MFS transporter [Candidatus Peregrinibacteria bacterium]
MARGCTLGAVRGGTKISVANIGLATQKGKRQTTKQEKQEYTWRDKKQKNGLKEKTAKEIWRKKKGAERHMETVETKPKAKGAWAHIREYFANFKVLKECPPRYWGVQAINLLHCFAYFAFLNIATMFLGVDMGLSHENVGYFYGAFGVVSGVCLIFVSGPVTDRFGVRVSMGISIIGKVLSGLAIIGVLMSGMGKSLVGLCILALSLIVMGIGNAVVKTGFQVANRRFSTKRSEAAAFNVWYLVMNVGAALGAYSIDKLVPDKSMSFLPIIVLYAIVNLLALVPLFLMRSEAPVRAEDVKKKEEESFVEIFISVIKEVKFWKLTTLVTLYVPVQMAFIYISAISPDYWKNVMGNKAPQGMFQAINPIIIFTGLILIIPLLEKMNIVTMLVVGAIVSSCSMMVLSLPWQWFGATVYQGVYWLTIISMAVLAFGELTWSPKLNQITAQMAPENRIASYLGISSSTFFLAKMAAGALSGHMIERWCPEGIGEKMASGNLAFADSPGFMWLILGLMALSGPIITFFLRGWLFSDLRKKPQEEAAS